LVERATKCLAIAARSPPKRRSSAALAVSALVIVSCVVKVLEATMKSVRSRSTRFSVSTMCVPSTLETKWASGLPAAA